MKVLLILAFVAAATAQGYNSGYGAPAPGPQQPETRQPQVHRHVYVHVAPDEPVDEQSKVIRVPGGDKHVNIIFVKTPSQSSSQQTEVILPDQDEHKNLVYVLLKKGESNSNIKVRGPPPARPQKPEVYFIRYKDQEAATQGPSYGAPAPVRTPAPVPNSNYGSPY